MYCIYMYGDDAVASLSTTVFSDVCFMLVIIFVCNVRCIGQMCEEAFPASLRVIGSLNQNSLFLEGTCILRV